VLPDIVAARPDDLALDDLSRTRTFAALWDRGTRLGRWLRHDLGVGPEGHVATLLGNRVEAVEAALGSVLAGTWFTPVNWHLTAEEASFILGDSGASVVVTDPEHEALARAAAALVPGDLPVVVAGDDLDAALAGAFDEPFPLDGPAGGSMIYTSGTTGRPKGVKRSKQASLARQLAGYPTQGRALGLDGSGPHLVTGPLYHAAPLGYALMDLHGGAPLVLMPRWDEAQCLTLIAERRVRSTHLVPTMFVRLLRLPDDVRAAFDPSPLEVVLHGAAPISPAVKQRMIDWWGPVLVEYWGASEGGVVTLVGSADWLAHPGTVGRAIAGYEVFAADEAGTPLPAGETGRLWCRHPGASRVFEYHNDPAKTDESELAPGTYTIGDVGRVDDDGWPTPSSRVA
jgi:long-chain acyl-CoA synthetase